MRAFGKLTERVDGELRIISDPPGLIPLDELFTGAQRSKAENQMDRWSTSTGRRSTAIDATSSTDTDTFTPPERWSA